MAPEPPPAAAPARRPVTVVRIIARLNVGGPAIHTVLLTVGLGGPDFRSILVCGKPGEQEGDMGYYARELGVEPRNVPELGRELSWRDDWNAFRALLRLLREERPQIVHTHTAKAGVVGRLAALVAGVPIRVHTFHGHVFQGYFSPLKTRIFLWIERFMAAFTTRVVAISERQRDDLCDVYRVVPRQKCTVIPLGFDLSVFEHSAARRGEIRRELPWPADRLLVGIIGRLVPIKNHAMFLEAARRVLEVRQDVGFVIAGDGELRSALESAARDLGIADHVHFLGWRRDLGAIYADLDIVALTSLNEGTPVALIEAMASGRPVVATDVGGVADVVAHQQTGLLVPSRDAMTCAEAMLRLLAEPPLRERMGQAGRERALARYGSRRLVGDVRALYEELLAAKGLTRTAGAANPNATTAARPG